MIKIRIIALGKLKESYLREAAEEYSKRLSRYCSLEITELNPVKLPDNPKDSEIETALANEKETILSKIQKGSRIIALCIEGKQISSEDLGEIISNSANFGSGDLTFIIGSSYGLSSEIKNRADVKISMSKMTFTHQMARVILLEQIYRAFKINEGGSYHK